MALETWNYRILKHKGKNSTWFALHEVFYDEKGKVDGWTEDPIDFSADSKRELIKMVEQALSDIKALPVLRHKK